MTPGTPPPGRASDENGQMSESGAPGEQAPGEVGSPGESGSPAESAEGKPAGHGHSGGQAGPPGGGHRLPDPWGELMHLAGEVAAVRARGGGDPAGRRGTRGEPRLYGSLSCLPGNRLQVLLPHQLIPPLPPSIRPAAQRAPLISLA